MANVKITDLTELSAVDIANDDVLPIVDLGNDSTKKVTIASLTATLAAANDFATYTLLNANIDQVSANADAYYIQLNANIDVVQANVSALSSVLTVSNTNTTDDVTVGTDDLVFAGTGGLTPLITNDTVTFQLDDTAVTAGLYGGVEGTTTNVAVITVDAQGRITAASNATVAVDLATLEGNVDVVQDNVVAAEGNIVALSTNVDVVQDNVVAAEGNITALTANVNIVQDNVVAAEANVVAVETRRATNTTIFINAFTGTNAAIEATESRLNSNLDVTNDNAATLTTTVDNFGTYANTNLDTKANVSATYFLALANDYASYTRLQANIDLVQDNVATVSVGTAADTEARLNANLDVTNDNVSTLTTTVDNFGTSSNANAVALALEDAALQTRLGANVTSLQNEDTALQARIAANALVAASNDYVTYTRLDANVSAVQDNVAAAEANIASIIDGSTAFTGDVTMNQALTVSGNLYVIGAQVDLGISSAQIDDATLLLAANTPADAQLGVDSGIVINRGQDANVFFGFAQYGDHIDFIFTDAPADNAAHYPIAYIDVHANSFGAEGTHDPTYTAVHHADRPTTGFYFPTNEIVGVIGGAYKANITASGLEAVAVYSDGVELRANDSATYLAALSNDYVTHTQISANVDIVQDNVAQNATDISAVEARRVANIAGAVSTITTDNLTASRALASDGSGKVAVSAVTSTELGYLDGVTSAIQTQIDSKSSTANAASLAAGIAGITPIGTSDISDNAVTVDKLAATLDLGALS